MERYNPNKHHRRSIRLQGYDYSQEGLYFVTICCQDRAHLFGKIENGRLTLNIFGKIALSEWLNTSNVRDNIIVHESIVMPNHIHGIIEIVSKKGDNTVGYFKSPSETIGSIVRGYKIAAIKKIKENILLNSGSIGGDSKGEDSKGGYSKDEDSKGELQFAPTDLTAPTVTQIDKIKSLGFKIWQRNYYEHIIRDERAYENISTYIINNPKKWEEDKLY